MSLMALAAYNNLSVTAALPDIGDDLGHIDLLPWVVTVELVAAAIAVLAIGPYIDGAGASRTFRVTLMVFLATSAICAVAPTMELLITGRLLQGLGAGALIGTSLTCIGLTYEESVRPWAYALMSTMWGVMGLGGPAIAAVLVSTMGWRAVFAVNLPVAALAALVGWNSLPQQGQARSERLDRTGVLLLSAMTLALLVATSVFAWYSLLLFGIGVALIALYARHARRSPRPVVRLSHVTARRWRRIHVAAAMAVTGGTGASVYLPVYLKAGRGSTVAFAAFAVIWPTLGWSASTWVSGKLQQYLPAANVALLGAVTLAVGSVTGALAAGMDAPVAVILATFVASGWGVGTITTASLSVLQGRAELAEMGRVSSAHQFIRSLGFTYGAALAGLVLFWVVERQTGDSEMVRGLLSDNGTTFDASVAEAVSSGFTASLGVMALLGILSLPPCMLMVWRPAVVGSPIHR